MATRKSQNQTNQYVIESVFESSEQPNQGDNTLEQLSHSHEDAHSEPFSTAAEARDSLSQKKHHSQRDSKGSELVSGRARKSKKQDGSLLQLFQSEFFNVHMLFRYLFEKQEEGVIAYLVNRLYAEPRKHIDFYLPQLW